MPPLLPAEASTRQLFEQLSFKINAQAEQLARLQAAQELIEPAIEIKRQATIEEFSNRFNVVEEAAHKLTESVKSLKGIHEQLASKVDTHLIDYAKKVKELSQEINTKLKPVNESLEKQDKSFEEL